MLSCHRQHHCCDDILYIHLDNCHRVDISLHYIIHIPRPKARVALIQHYPLSITQRSGTCGGARLFVRICPQQVAEQPVSGTSVGRGMRFICSSAFSSGDSPPCMHRICARCGGVKLACRSPTGTALDLHSARFLFHALNCSSASDLNDKLCGQDTTRPRPGCALRKSASQCLGGSHGKH